MFAQPVYPSYCTFLKSNSTAFLVRKMGETVLKAFLKLRCITSTICFCRKASPSRIIEEIEDKCQVYHTLFLFPFLLLQTCTLYLSGFSLLAFHEPFRHYQWEHFWNYHRQCFKSTQMKEFSKGLIIFLGSIW